MKNKSIFEIRKEQAKACLDKIGHDCECLGQFGICTGTRKIKIMNDLFYFECDLCGDQAKLESEAEKVKAEKDCLAQLISEEPETDLSL